MDFITAIGAAKSVSDILKTLSEKLHQKNPDLAAVRTLTSDLQQAAYELQSENLTLQRQIVQLESEKASMKQQLAAEDAWNQRIKEIELYVQTTGGAVVHRSKSSPQIYFCPSNCFESHHLIPLQDHGTSSHFCEGCGKTYRIKSSRHHAPEVSGPAY